VYKRHNGANQRWKIIYTDKAGPKTTKGLDEDFGIHINRPFYIRSRLPTNRALEYNGSYLYIKMWQMGKSQQQWVFGNNRVISPVSSKSRAIEIQSSGRSSNLTYNSISSRWW